MIFKYFIKILNDFFVYVKTICNSLRNICKKNCLLLQENFNYSIYTAIVSTHWERIPNYAIAIYLSLI